MSSMNKEDNVSMMKKQKPWYKYITVEPPMFLYMMAYMITNVIEQTFYIFQACTVNHGYSPEICYNISSYDDINKEVQVSTRRCNGERAPELVRQNEVANRHLERTSRPITVRGIRKHKLFTRSVQSNLLRHILNRVNISSRVRRDCKLTVSTFHQWNGVASHVVPLLLAFFIGSYSDKRGRKIILLAGLLGKLFFSAMITINTAKAWPVEYVIYTAAFPSALTGADLAIFAGCFAYIADVSSLKNRTLRVGILDVVYLSTMPSGVAIGNLLWNKVVNRSFTVMFAINTSLMVLATLYTVIFLKWQTRPEQKSLKQAGVKNPVTDFFDVKNIVQTLTILTQKRPKNRRLFLWFLLISMAFYTFQRDERSVMYLYTIKVFKWDTTAFSNFRTYLSTLYVIAMLLGIPLMTKVFHWRDTVIVMLGASAHICGHLVYAHAKTDKLWYVGATAAALGPCVAPLIRSMTSKVLPGSERGVAYAFLSVMENAVAMFASIIYSQLYKATLDTEFVNSIFYLTISTQVVVFMLIFTMEIMLRGRPLEPLYEKEEERRISTSS